MKKIVLCILMLLAACVSLEEPAPVGESSPAPVVEKSPEPAPVQEAAPEPTKPPVAAPEPTPEASPEPLQESVPSGATIEVTIDNMMFNPEDVKVKVGDTVVWVQNDGVPHSVTVTQGPAPDKFDSNVFRKGETFSHTFKIKGTYYYKCSLHPIMRGKVVVE
jgi:amicyanin